MILDKKALVEILKGTMKEIEGLGEREYYFEMKLIGIDKEFTPRAHGLQELLVKAANGYRDRVAGQEKMANIITKL